MDWLTDIVRLFDLPLATILGASPIYLPVVGFSWSVLPALSGRMSDRNADATE